MVPSCIKCDLPSDDWKEEAKVVFMDPGREAPASPTVHTTTAGDDRGRGPQHMQTSRGPPEGHARDTTSSRQPRDATLDWAKEVGASCCCFEADDDLVERVEKVHGDDVVVEAIEELLEKVEVEDVKVQHLATLRRL